MFKTSTSILIGVLAIIVGAVVIFCNNLIGAREIVVSGGIMFMVAGILNGLLTFFVKDADGKRKAKAAPFVFNIIASAAAVAFGICMLVMNTEFQKFMPMVFAILVLFGSLMLFYILGFGNRDMEAAKWLFVFPVLVLIGAVMIYLLKAPEDDSKIMIYTGVSIILYGMGLALTAANVAYRLRQKAKTPAEGTETDKQLASPDKSTDIKGLD